MQLVSDIQHGFRALLKMFAKHATTFTYFSKLIINCANLMLLDMQNANDKLFNLK